jgi:nucleoid-associated protein YgaU
MRMKLSAIMIFIFFLPVVHCQDEIEISQEGWEKLRDSIAVKAIILLARLDTLNIELDSLKKLAVYSENFDCEEELYKIVGATKDEAADFRKKFEITESKIVSKTGSPGESRSYYYNEIAASKIKCLPEFYDRFISMNKRIEEWESTFRMVVESKVDSFYTVVEGDYLKKIARERYGNSEYWSLIWEANKNGIKNAPQMNREYKKSITNPDVIYPGQVLFMPVIKK